MSNKSLTSAVLASIREEGQVPKRVLIEQYRNNSMYSLGVVEVLCSRTECAENAARGEYFVTFNHADISEIIKPPDPRQSLLDMMNFPSTLFAGGAQCCHQVLFIKYGPHHLTSWLLKSEPMECSELDHVMSDLELLGDLSQV